MFPIRLVGGGAHRKEYHSPCGSSSQAGIKTKKKIQHSLGYNIIPSLLIKCYFYGYPWVYPLSPDRCRASSFTTTQWFLQQINLVITYIFIHIYTHTYIYIIYCIYINIRIYVKCIDYTYTGILYHIIVYIYISIIVLFYTCTGSG